MRTSIVGLLAVTLTSVGGVSVAGPITYVVDITGSGFGDSRGMPPVTPGVGSIIGTITTDGTLGPLASANITAWSLLATAPGFSASETSGVFGAFNIPDGSGEMMASASSLTLVTSPGWLFDSEPPSGQQGIQFAQGFDVFSIALGTPNQLDFFIEGAPSVIATAVPEPATLSLLGIGIAGVALARRRKVQTQPV